MSVFGRLTRILRAQLESSRQSERPGAERFEGAPTAGGEESQNPTDAAVDPEIAGYYANLEAPYGADLQTVKKSWKRLLQKYHPDLHSRDPEKRRVALELSQGLNRAYEALKEHLT